MEKTCFRCHATKPLDEFYRHPQMSDGRLGKCKECTKADVRADYASLSKTKKQKRRKRVRLYMRNYRKTEDQAKRGARMVVCGALLCGALKKGPCEQHGPDCKGRIEAHHDNYSKPLEVRWVCQWHHSQF